MSEKKEIKYHESDMKSYKSRHPDFSDALNGRKIELKMEKGFAEGIDHDMPNRFEFNRLFIRILELERKVAMLESNEKWKGPNG